MKKFFLVAIAVAGAWGVFQANQNNNAQLSDLQMENVELLALGAESGEGGGGGGRSYPCDYGVAEYEPAGIFDKVIVSRDCECQLISASVIRRYCK